MFSLATIGRPLHVHNARTADVYLYTQAAFIARQRRERPHLPWRDPWDWDGAQPQAIVDGGYWKVVPCLADGCGNAPSVEPAWRLACCLECGAVYRDVVVPDNWEAIELSLLRRPVMATRNWRGETIAQLDAETLAHANGVG